MKMKKLTALLLATLMVLSLAACGTKKDDNGGSNVDLTAQQVLDKLKETLGDSL